MNDLKRQIELMDIVMIYKGKVLVDQAEVLKIIDAQRPEDSTDVLKRSMEEMQTRLQEIRGRSV